MATPPAGSRDATPSTGSDTGRHVNTIFLPDSLDSQKPSGTNGVPLSRCPISPPPIRRLASIRNPATAASLLPLSDRVSSTNASGANDRDTPKVSDVEPESNANLAGPVATPSPSSRTKRRSKGTTGTPKAQMAVSSKCSVDGIANRLKKYSKDIRQDHAQMVAHAIESTVATERRVFTGRDLFAGLSCKAVPQIKGRTMRLKSKQHLKGKKSQTVEQHFEVVRIKTNKDAVPSYRFHHVEIKKNILAPNSMLTFVPHLRDLQSSDVPKFNAWEQELKEIELKSGFQTIDQKDKRGFLVRSERAATMSLYLESWLNKLAIPHCNKSTLVRYLASQKSNDAKTPQQGADIFRSPRNGDNLASDAIKAARMFTEAFESMFRDTQPSSNDKYERSEKSEKSEEKEKKDFVLRQVLSRELREESTDNATDNKSVTKEASAPQHDNIDETLGTYCILGCFICFSHSCDHGEFDIRNLKRSFSLCSPLTDILRRKRAISSAVDGVAKVPCTRRCHRLGITSDPEGQRKEWTEDEHILLRSLYITSDHGRLTMDPICLAAEFLNRNCYDVYTEFLYLDISRPQLEPMVQQKPPNIEWYDHSKKMLLGDWQARTVSHEHHCREIVEPCFHDGPCAPKVCSCVDAGVLCEKFCGCTEATCSYKFTGCACHSQGKTCIAKQKDKPCICVQLNRECDPQLCGSCGALDHADPANADDVDLHSTGCQNCELQRGVHKNLLLGRSQLDGVGYGLFTAEDIAQDEFVIEYVGELITHDEGVRREARRGDPFDEKSNISYVFTLLDNEGIWVDAAVYGNLSRYINHASEDEARGCNIIPRILYVNGEYRIKFTALRHIKAGEELFFNYGEHFPNLTQKLMDNKAGEKAADAVKRKVGRPRRAEAEDRVARKASKPEPSKMKRSEKIKKLKHRNDSPLLDEEDTAKVSKTRKRKRGIRDDSTENEYRPTTAKNRTFCAYNSEDDSGDAARLVARRPGKKARPHSDTEEADTPSKKGKDQPKRKSKRGGARQGSGRPKKSQASELNQASKSSTAEASTSVPSPTKVTTPKQNKSIGREQEIPVIEIEDSEEDDSMVKNRASRNRRMPAKFRDEEVETYPVTKISKEGSRA